MKKLLINLTAIALIAAPSLARANSVALVNPLGETDVRVLFGRVIAGALSVIGSFALLMFVYGGVLWMTSRGDTKQVQKGKDTLTWAILGLVIIFSAYVLVNALIAGITTGNAA